MLVGMALYQQSARPTLDQAIGVRLVILFESIFVRDNFGGIVGKPLGFRYQLLGEKVRALFQVDRLVADNLSVLQNQQAGRPGVIAIDRHFESKFFTLAEVTRHLQVIYGYFRSSAPVERHHVNLDPVGSGYLGGVAHLVNILVAVTHQHQTPLRIAGQESRAKPDCFGQVTIAGRGGALEVAEGLILAHQFLDQRFLPKDHHPGLLVLGHGLESFTREIEFLAFAVRPDAIRNIHQKNRRKAVAGGDEL